MPPPPTRDAAAVALAQACQQGPLTAEILSDWRLHPHAVVWLVEHMGARGVLLEVGCGRVPKVAPLVRGVAMRVAVDIKTGLVACPGVTAVRADVAALPLASGSVSVVVSRMLLGAPVSQAARRKLATNGQARNATLHLQTARAHEAAWHSELARVCGPGAVVVHICSERISYAHPPPRFQLRWALEPAHVAPAPPLPWSQHPLQAARHLLGSVMVLDVP